MGFYNPNPLNQPESVSQPGVIAAPAVQINTILKYTYIWMAVGMLTTAGLAWFAATVPALEGLRGNLPVMIVAIVLLFGSVIALSAGLTRKWLTPGLAAGLFLLIAGINGFTLSLVLEYFIANDPGALVSAFGTATILFGTMSIFGFTTNMDLTKMGTFLFMGLIGLIVAMVFNWFIGSSALSFLISFIGVVIFTGLTAYDTQKIKEMSMNPELQSDGNMALKFSVLGALTLYLDFLNLFLFLLQLFGGGGRD